jgi:hypothetical protein
MQTPPDQDRDPEHVDSPAGAEVREEPSPPRPKRWRRRLGILGAFGLLSILAVIFLGPVVIAWVAESMIVDAGERHGYTVTVASSSFDWWEGLTVEGIVARENIPHGIRAEAASIVAAPRWRGLLGGTWALGRFRIDRPNVTLDPARKPPKRPPRKSASQASPSSAREDMEGQPVADEPLNVELPLTVVDGTVEVLPAQDRPGLRLEHLNVNGRLRGPDRHFNGTVVGDLVAGNRREPLRLSGDIVLGDRQRKPSGSGQYAVGEIDLTCLQPFLKTRGGPIVKRGTLRMNGEVRAEGPVLRLVGSATLRNLELAHPDDPARVFETPRAELKVKASYHPTEQRLVLEWGRLEGGPLDLELEGSASTAAGPGRTAELTIRPQGRIERLAPLIPEIEGISGALGGKLEVRLEKRRAAVVADLVVSDLVWKLRGDPGAPAGAENTIRDPRLATHLELAAGPREKQTNPASGKVKLIGNALRLDATFEAKAFPDDLHVKGTLGGETPRLLRQLGFAVPAGLQASGAFASDFEANLGDRSGERAKNRSEGILGRLNGQMSVRGLHFRRDGIDVNGLAFRANLGRDRLELLDLAANVNGGTLSAGGRIDLGQTGRAFQVHLQLNGVQVTQYLAKVVQYFVPLYHIPDGIDGQVGGAVSANLDLEGRFPPWSGENRKVLKGKGGLKVDRGFVEGSPMVGQVLARLGHRQRYEFENLVTGFTVMDDGVIHKSFQARDRELAWGFKGRTGFDTTIDYRLDPGPILERLYRGKERKGKLRGWERALKEALQGLGKAPISLGGTLDAPRLKMDLLPVPGGKTEIPLNDILNGLLGGKKKKQ